MLQLKVRKLYLQSRTRRKNPTELTLTVSTASNLTGIQISERFYVYIQIYKICVYYHWY